MIPASRIDPVSLNIINKYMPSAEHVRSSQLCWGCPGDLTVNQGIVRVDQYFSQQDQLFVHYIRAFRNFPNAI